MWAPQASPSEGPLLCHHPAGTRGATVHLHKEVLVVDALQPAALQRLQVPVGLWAQQVQILHTRLEVLQVLLQLVGVLGGKGRGGEHAQVASQHPRCSPGDLVLGMQDHLQTHPAPDSLRGPCSLHTLRDQPP